MPEPTTPTLVYDERETCWIFTGFDVHAELDGDPEDTLGVASFSSMASGRGNAGRALRWLKARCPRLGACDPGEAGTDSRAFWDHMADKDVITWMEDADGRSIDLDRTTTTA